MGRDRFLAEALGDSMSKSCHVIIRCKRGKEEQGEKVRATLRLNRGK